MLFSRFAQTAAAFVLLTIGFAAPAHAQNNKQIISGNWYEDRAVTHIDSLNLTLTFAQTPTDKFLNVTNVSCTIQTAPNQSISEFYLQAGTSSGVGDLGRPYPLKGNTTPEIVGTSKYYSVVTNQIYFKFGPGRFPSMIVNTSTSDLTFLTAECVMVGNLTDN
jgi:hypothetical protein